MSRRWMMAVLRAHTTTKQAGILWHTVRAPRILAVAAGFIFHTLRGTAGNGLARVEEPRAKLNRWLTHGIVCWAIALLGLRACGAPHLQWTASRNGLLASAAGI